MRNEGVVSLAKRETTPSISVNAFKEKGPLNTAEKEKRTSGSRRNRSEGELPQ